MKQVRNEFATEREKQAFVDDCEADFEAKLDEVSAAVTARESLRYVLLSGPSCACKSTVVKKIEQDVVGAGKRIRIISIDDFFLSRTEDRERALRQGDRIDFDSIDALDFPLFCECLQEIFTSRRVMLPLFDFKSAKRSGYTAFDPAEVDLILFEGIQAIYPEITSLFEGQPSMRIYIDVQGTVWAGDVPFSGRKIRFCRRLVRDHRFRNASPSFTMFLWQSVVENEMRNMTPYAPTAEVHLDSFIPYELGILREPLTEVLETVHPEDPYYVAAQNLLADFAHITPISNDYLPPDSIYREFLG